MMFADSEALKIKSANLHYLIKYGNEDQKKQALAAIFALTFPSAAKSETPKKPFEEAKVIDVNEEEEGEDDDLLEDDM